MGGVLQVAHKGDIVLKTQHKFKTFLFLCLAALFCFGLSAQTGRGEQKYPSGTEFYPAVYGAITELYPDAKFFNIDFYNNSYTVTGITGGRLANNYSYDLKIQLSDDGGIEYSISNIYTRIGSGSSVKWNKTTGFLIYSYKKAVEDLLSQVVLITSQTDSYERWKKEAMSDIGFVQAVLQALTNEVAFKDFYENHVKDSVITVKALVSEVKEHGKEVNGTIYKYFVSLLYNSGGVWAEKSASVVLPSASSFANVYCFYYTNSNDVIRFKRGSTVTIKGKAVDLRKQPEGKAVNLKKRPESAGGFILKLVDE